MEISNIASAKSHFSHLIDLVKQCETVLITERNKPVATLQPVVRSAAASLDTAYASGLLTPPGKPLDLAAFLAAFLAAPRPAIPAAGSLRDAILNEREEGR